MALSNIPAFDLQRINSLKFKTVRYITPWTFPNRKTIMGFIRVYSGSEFPGLKMAFFDHFWAVLDAYKRHTPLIYWSTFSPELYWSQRGQKSVENRWKSAYRRKRIHPVYYYQSFCPAMEKTIARHVRQTLRTLSQIHYYIVFIQWKWNKNTIL